MSEEEKQQETESGPRFCLTFCKRDPAVKLLHPVSGVEPLAWSEDHRVSVCTANHLAVLEHVCDINGNCPDLTLHRTSLPAPLTSCHLKVGSPEEVEECRMKFARTKDPTISQAFMLDRVFNPDGNFLPPLTGFKYSSWSPVGCDENGRCLLAALTLDNRLTINANINRLQWKPLVDLTERYGKHLFEANYKVDDSDSPPASIDDFSEFKRRHSMQTPVRMEWSGICTTQQVMENNECRDVSTLLLAVLFENGNIVVWQFQVPFVNEESIVSCNTIETDVESPSVLEWWEYEHNNRKMSGLIVGSHLGPIKILPVNLKAVKGYFTLRQPVILWKEMDRLPVNSIKCVALYHPYQKCSCSLVVAARGCYIFWCLLLISKAGLNVHNSHVTGLHSLPVLSMAVDKVNGTVYTSSVEGNIRQLVPIFTAVALKFEHQLIKLSDVFGAVKCHGITVSPCGAYLACITSEGLKNGVHPVNQNYQVNFVALKTFEEAAAQLLESSNQNLFRQMDLTDLLRWKILKEKLIPQFLLDELDKKMDGGSLYFWRFRLLLLRTWYHSLKNSAPEAPWKQPKNESKVPTADDALAGSSKADEQDDRDGDSPSKQSDEPSPGEVLKDPAEAGTSSQSAEVLQDIQQKINAVEEHLFKENMKRVLGEVYMHTCVTENSRVPTRGICDYLADKNGDDRNAQVLIGHLEKKMSKQTFPEYCILCKEVLPFSDCKLARCSKGHLWIRCNLTFQACQSLQYRRCLFRDSFAVRPVPEDPPWIKKLLQGSCTLCDSLIY
ncbi:general transcription factor 3C polypeptide 4 [Spea bombifrons]|uniref:general transcription factor 3C polypeptide 4 n=1 Tax=Spea bombifrons TaxID=233779 RepID=UPI00234A11DF|nr:general transcription factor 3C polypeptide 4 [Spea bombifrons]